MKLLGRVNAIQVTRPNGNVDILLAVLYAVVNDGQLDVCFRRGREYIHALYEAGTWAAVEEIVEEVL